MDKSILGGESLKLVGSSSELVSSLLLEVLGNLLSESNVSVETSANSGTTLGNFVNILEGLNDALVAVFELVNVS